MKYQIGIKHNLFRITETLTVRKRGKYHLCKINDKIISGKITRFLWKELICITVKTVLGESLPSVQLNHLFPPLP